MLSRTIAKYQVIIIIIKARPFFNEMTSNTFMTTIKKRVEDKKKMSKKDVTITNKKRKANEDQTTSSSEAKTKKRALKQLRQSTRKHHEDVTQMKELWNKLRVKDNDKRDIERRMEELMKLLTGEPTTVLASRFLQSIICDAVLGLFIICSLSNKYKVNSFLWMILFIQERLKKYRCNMMPPV